MNTLFRILHCCTVSSRIAGRIGQAVGSKGRLAFLAVTALAVMTNSAQAATDTWNGGTNDWNTLGNWSGGVPIATSTATFSGTANPNITLSAVGTTGSILFTGASVGAYTIGTTGGPAITLASGGSISTDSGVANIETVNAPLILGGTSASTYSFSSGSSTTTDVLNIGGTVAGAATSGITTLTLTGTNTGVNTVSGNISNGAGGGALAITKTSTGTWVLSGTNTYTGGTTLSAGTLDIGSATALGTGTFWIGSLASFDNTSGGALTIANVVTTAGGASAGFTFGGTKNVTFTNTTGTPFNFNQNNNTVTLGGTNSVLTFLGAGTLSNAGASSVVTTINGAGNTLVIGSLNLNSANHSNNPAVGRIAFIEGSGNLTITGVVSDGGTGTVGAANTLAQLETTTFTGTLTLSGANTYGGGSLLQSGTTILNNGGSLAGGAVIVTGSTLVVQGNYTIGTASSGSLQISQSAAGTLNMVDGTINTLTLQNNTVAATTLSLGGTNNPATLKMEVGATADEIVLQSNAEINISSTHTPVVNLTGLGGLDGNTHTLISAPGGMSGTGTFSSFTLGTTTGNFGGYSLGLSATSTALLLTETANPAAANAYWNGASSLVTAQGGTTAWNSFVNGNTNTSNFGVSPGGTGNASGLVGSTTNIFFDSGVTSPLSTTLGQDLTVNSVNFSSSQAVSIGSNTLTIQGATANGNAAPNGITVATGAANDTISSNVVLGNSQTWTVTDVSNTLTVSGGVSGTGPALTKAGAGSVALTGNNSYTGGTIVSAGTLYANNGTSSTGTGAVSVSSGGTLAGTGTIAPTGINGISVANGGILAPGSGQSVPFTGTPGTVASQGLTVGNAAPVTFATGAKLTFALGAGGSSSALSVMGSTVTFTSTGSNVVTINDLVGANLTVGQEYVLFAGNGSTVWNNLGLGAVTSNGTLITGGLSLLAANTPGNFFADWYTGSQLYLVGDNIVVDVVPEPGTWAMMLGGFALLLFYQRKRRS